MYRIWFIDRVMTFTHLIGPSEADRSIATNPLQPYEFLIYEG